MISSRKLKAIKLTIDEFCVTLTTNNLGGKNLGEFILVTVILSDF